MRTFRRLLYLGWLSIPFFVICDVLLHKFFAGFFRAVAPYFVLIPLTMMVATAVYKVLRFVNAPPRPEAHTKWFEGEKTKAARGPQK
jgi:hypothetical protein